jgi:hypothetical protein
MAAATGMSQSAVSRIWRAFGLKPHQTELFKPLERAYSQTTESWGTQAIYSLGGGWAELLNSN